MGAVRSIEDNYQDSISGVRDYRFLISRTASYVRDTLKADRVFAKVITEDLNLSYETALSGDYDFGRRLGVMLKNGGYALGGKQIKLPGVIDKSCMQNASVALTREFSRIGADTIGIMPVEIESGKTSWLECHFYEKPALDSSGVESFLTEVSKGFKEAALAVGQTVQSEFREEAVEDLSTSPALREDLIEGESVVVDIDSEGRVVHIGSQFERIFNRRVVNYKNESIDRLLQELLVDGYQKKARQQIRRVLAKKESTFEFIAGVIDPVTGKYGHFIFRVEADPFNSEHTVLLLTEVSIPEVEDKRLQAMELRSMRVVEHGSVVVLRTDSNYIVTDVIGDTEGLFGVAHDQILKDRFIWNRIVRSGDLRKLFKQVEKKKRQFFKVSEEVRIRNQASEEDTWVYLNAVPLISDDGEFKGWEAFFFDITSKRKTEWNLKQQQKRIEALYEVSNSLLINRDPTFIVLRGLQAAIDATIADSGTAVFKDPDTGQLEIVASHGLSSEFINKLSQGLNTGQSLIKHSIEARRSVLSCNLSNNPHVAQEIAAVEGLKSAVIVPLIFRDRNGGERVVGAIAVYGNKTRQFQREDLDLVTAVSAQIGMVVRQAEHYAEEKRQAASWAALYELSHELSQVFSPEDIAACAFPVIQKEMACKRMWFATLNDHDTHLIGHRGFGPGISEQMAHSRVEIGPVRELLETMIKENKTIIYNSADEIELEPVRKIFIQMKMKTLIFFPLVALGQFVGTLAIEPAVSSRPFMKGKEALLRSIANEIASVVLTRRFESKVMDAEKMRVISMMSSGIAHNFNNLLQAVIGQASLIEMKAAGDESLSKVARSIIDTSGKGAGLIKQMLSLSEGYNESRESFSVDDFIEESTNYYHSCLDPQVKLKFKLGAETGRISADYGKLQQIITHMLVNAQEAFESKTDGVVRIKTKRVRISRGDFSGTLTPGWYVKIAVEDNGRGMSREEQERCFEPFFTTKETDSATGIGITGAGLGLSVSNTIVQQYGGTITVQSRSGRGTIFSIFLPLAAGSVTENLIPEEPTDQPEPRGTTLISAILMQSDNISAGVEMTLKSLQIPIRTVANLEEFMARDYAESELLILDLDRFSRDQLGAIDRIKDRKPGLRILGGTANPDQWKDFLSENRGEWISVMRKPLGVWAVHSVLQRIPSWRGKERIESRVEKIKVPDVRRRDGKKARSHTKTGGEVDE